MPKRIVSYAFGLFLIGAGVVAASINEQSRDGYLLVACGLIVLLYLRGGRVNA